jgi:diguanylate cyclase (GGDEF)-like protein/PAS domain S-box-containing protein
MLGSYLVTGVGWLSLFVYAVRTYLSASKEFPALRLLLGALVVFTFSSTVISLYGALESAVHNGYLLEQWQPLLSTSLLRYLPEGTDFLALLLIAWLAAKGGLQKHVALMQGEKLACMQLSDLKERVRSQGDIIRLYEILSDVNRLRFDSVQTDDLLREAFSHLSRYPHFDVLWVGMSESGGKRLAKHFSVDRTEPAFLENDAFLAVDPEEPSPMDIAVHAFLSDTTVIAEDIQTTPLPLHVRTRARFSGLHSAAAIPLRDPENGKPVGVACIFSSKPLTRYCEEVQILEELMGCMMESTLLQRRENSRNERDISLTERNTLLEGIISTIPVRVFWKDTQLRYLGCNDLFAKDAHLTDPGQILGKRDTDLLWSENARTYGDDDRYVLETGKELFNRVERQGELWRMTNKAPLRDAEGRIVGIVGSYSDFTLQKRAEAYLKENEQRFRELLDQIPNIAVLGYDKNRRVTYWNRQSERLYGYTKKDALGTTIEELVIPHEERERFLSDFADWMHRSEAIKAGEQRLRHSSGKLVDVYASHIMLNRHGEHPEIYAIGIDLTRQKHAEEKLNKLANYDALTDLPNRHALGSHLKKLISKSRRTRMTFALFFIDLDNFKYINDTFGHEYGDKLLVKASRRIRSVLRDYDFIARFGGDEFIVTVEYEEDTSIISHIAEKIIHTLNRVFVVRTQDLFVSSSIGISLFPFNTDDKATLLKQADTAMYQAKKEGKNRYHYFTHELNSTMEEEMRLERKLRKDVKEHRLNVHFQPQIDLRSKAMLSCEALLRWYDDESRTYIPPEKLLPIAHKTHLMEAITLFVIESCIDLLRTWYDAGIDPVRIDINMTTEQLNDHKTLNHLLDAIESHRIDAKHIGIEITENQMLDFFKSNAKEQLEKLTGRGIHISIDDFGTGYSSLAYLKNLHIDTIKIDKAFILQSDNEHNRALVRSIIAMTHELGYSVLAEGVETEGQLRFLQQSNCDKAQGFYFYKALPAQEITAILKKLGERKSTGDRRLPYSENGLKTV